MGRGVFLGRLGGAMTTPIRPEELRYILDTKGADYLERRYPISSTPRKEKP